METKIEGVRLSANTFGKATNGEYVPPSGGVITSIDTQNQTFTYAFLQVKSGETWYTIGQ
ncbi:hypothetical protein [Sodalis sp. RH20]|uniref:hypothetical protein n=1 Tax=unclassified Sodalis (in: enterobacteria) TaxID=2636512 RepID=UPI0039B58DB3